MKEKNAIIYSSLHRKRKSTYSKAKGCGPVNSEKQIKGIKGFLPCIKSLIRKLNKIVSKFTSNEWRNKGKSLWQLLIFVFHIPVNRCGQIMKLLQWGTNIPISFLLRAYYFHSFNALIEEQLYFKPQKEGKFMFKRRRSLFGPILAGHLCILIHVSYMLGNTHCSKKMVNARKTVWALLSTDFEHK